MHSRQSAQSSGSFSVSIPSLLLTALLFASSAPPAYAQTSGLTDGIAVLLQRLEALIRAGDSAEYAQLFVEGNPARAREFVPTTLPTTLTRTVVRERERLSLGQGKEAAYRLVVEIFTEAEGAGQITTWQMDLRRTPFPAADGEPDMPEWRVTAVERVAAVDGLYRLALDPTRQFAARNLQIHAEDLDLQLSEGSVFVAEAGDGITALVLLGRGEMVFRPTPAAERGQVRIFSGADTLQTAFDATFIRINPADFKTYVASEVLQPRDVVPQELKRAQEIFREDVGKSFGLDLADLSQDSWSLLPTTGDFVAEIRTRRFEILTYARSGREAEDISLFDRRRRRNIAVYASQQKLAVRGPFYSEDSVVDYDVLDYDIAVTFAPEREWLEGRARLTLKIRSTGATSLVLRLAESLVVRSVSSDRFGRLLSLRVRNQEHFVINLPTLLARDAQLVLDINYGGRLEPQPADRETLLLQGPQPVGVEPGLLPQQPRYLYSNRSYWYPQSQVSDYALATLRLTVPAEFDCVASGELVPGTPISLAPPTRTGLAHKLFVFRASQPVRYLACLISRFARVETATVLLEPGAIDTIIAPARSPDLPAPQESSIGSLRLSVEANPRQQGYGHNLLEASIAVAQFYAAVMGDVPYPGFVLAIVENDLPGGHSPAYFAALNQPSAGSRSVWRDDPAAFENYPEFFIAHELAHQWWGQAVGWKNYHEQWLSEGVAQYFAALFAQHHRGTGVFAGIIRQFQRWTMAQSDRGPVYLGYRLGHLKNESRTFRALVYNKGALVLHMLRRLVGDDAFFRGVRRFYDTWRFRKAGTEDLQQAFEAETGRSLERFFTRWIYEADLPRVKFSHSIDRAADGQQLVLRFEQLGQLFDLPVTVTLQYADRPAVDLVVAVTDRVSETRVPLAGQLRGVEVNRDDAAPAEIIR